MNPKYFILKQEDDELKYDELLLLDNPSSLKIVEHEIRLKILELLSKKAMYPAEIARELKMHEQKVYYHIKQLMNSGVLEIIEKEEVRGTIAKKLAPKNMNFALLLKPQWKSMKKLITKDKDTKISKFMEPFIKNSKLDAEIIVGSPDPHGEFKARARDGHYAIDLALSIGSMCNMPKDFSTRLDVDIDPKSKHNNMIIVGGPVTNLVCNKINEFLPAYFDQKNNWALTTKKDVHTEENIGIIARIRNPYDNQYSILVIAGIRYSGTKAAVIGLTRYSDLILNRFSDQKEFYCIVQGFDLDGDGKIDSVELVE